MTVIKQARRGVEEKFHQLCQKVAAQEGLALYDLEWLPGSSTLRLFISNPARKGGLPTANLDDCGGLDRALDPWFEQEDWIPPKLTLEVSSPGLFRRLNSVPHFKAVIGYPVGLKLVARLGNFVEDLPKARADQYRVEGTLRGVNPKGIELDSDGTGLSLRFEWIKSANLRSEA